MYSTVTDFKYARLLRGIRIWESIKVAEERNSYNNCKEENIPHDKL
jgi:hypothetical protein